MYSVVLQKYRLFIPFRNTTSICRPKFQLESCIDFTQVLVKSPACLTVGIYHVQIFHNLPHWNICKTKTQGKAQLGSVSACVLTHFDPQGCFLQWYSRSSFGFALRKYAYVQSDGPTALEAWQPWGFYFGQRYHEPWPTTCWYHIHFGHGHFSGHLAPTKNIHICIYIHSWKGNTFTKQKLCCCVSVRQSSRVYISIRVGILDTSRHAGSNSNWLH